MNVSSLVQGPRAEHLLKQLKEQHRLERPQLGGRLEVSILEDLPPNVIRYEESPLSGSLSHLQRVSAFEATGAETHHGKE